MDAGKIKKGLGRGLSSLIGETKTEVKTNKISISDLIPNKYFKDPTLKWLDPCAGRGYFCIILYKKLFQGLKEFYPDDKKRHNHITSYMLHMVELNSTFIPVESLNARGSTKTTPAIAFAPYRIPSAPFITLNLSAI